MQSLGPHSGGGEAESLRLSFDLHTYAVASNKKIIIKIAHKVDLSFAHVHTHKHTQVSLYKQAHIFIYTDTSSYTDMKIGDFCVSYMLLHKDVLYNSSSEIKAKVFYI